MRRTRSCKSRNSPRGSSSGPCRTVSGQKLDIDLKKLGVDPNNYDELRFDLKPLGSQVGLHTTLFGMPTENELTSWYTKFRTATDKWSTGRFDLRVDDDGAESPKRFGDFKAGILHFELYSRIRGYPGEPKWRKAILAIRGSSDGRWPWTSSRAT